MLFSKKQKNKLQTFLRHQSEETQQQGMALLETLLIDESQIYDLFDYQINNIEDIDLALKSYPQKRRLMVWVLELLITVKASWLCNQKTLSLYGKSLSSLPKSIGMLTQLQHLNLEHNQLSLLPESMGNLTQLQTLNLRHNDVSNLPEFIGKLSQLTEVNLGSNVLGSLPQSIGDLSMLEGLWLQCKQKGFSIFL